MKVLARLASHDGPITLLPLDFLCLILHQCLREFVPDACASTSTEYARSHSDVTHLRLVPIGSGRQGACLVRMETVKFFNRCGAVTQVVYWRVRAAMCMTLEHGCCLTQFAAWVGHCVQ